MSLRIVSIFILTSFFTSLTAQIDGDNIFGQDQVITVALDFPDSDFYNALVDEYNGDQNYIWAGLTLTDNTGTYAFDSVGVRLKGNSSFNHPGTKKSFKLDFNEYVSGQNYDGLKKLNFSNGFKDPAVIREKVFFDVCRAAEVPAPRASFANVIFNGEPWGFYTVIEQIDDQFLDWNIMEDSGNLFKAGDNFGVGPGGGGVPADLVYYGAEQSSYIERYELKTNEDLDDWTDLIELIDFINNSSDAEFEAELANRMELTDFLRFAALDNLFSNLDSYTGSARNYYIYHNQITGKWEWVKWDSNESFGSYTNMAGNMINLALDYHNSDRPLLDRVFLSDVLYELYLEQVCDLTENYFNTDYLDARIDVLKLLVQEHVYEDDAKMYSNADFDTNIESDISFGGGGGGGTIYGLKSFVTQRSAFVDGEVECDLFTGLIDESELEFNIYPNPASNTFTIRWVAEAPKYIQVMDLQGRIVKERVPRGADIASFNVGDISHGLYLVRMLYADGSSREQMLLIE